MDRRTFVGACLAPGILSLASNRAAYVQEAAADYTIHIGAVDVEIAPRRIIKTIGYNGSVPGPLLRMTEGTPVTIAVYSAGSGWVRRRRNSSGSSKEPSKI